MDVATIIADLQIAVNLANLAIQTGTDAAPFVTNAYNILFKGKTLTAGERAAMLSQEAVLRAQLQAPLPPET